MSKRYRKKPVEIEAEIWTGDNFEEVFEFTGRKDNVKIGFYGLQIMTLEGPLYAEIGDYIIQGVEGEFYPCKPQIFKKTYEEV